MELCKSYTKRPVPYCAHGRMIDVRGRRSKTTGHPYPHAFYCSSWPIMGRCRPED